MNTGIAAAMPGPFDYQTGISSGYHLSTRWFLRRYAELTGKSLMGAHEFTSIA